MPTLSLRARIMLGAVLWTTGLLVVATVALVHLMSVYPTLPKHVHNFFGHVVPLLLIASVCMAVGLLRVRGGMAAITQLRARLAAVHQGTEARVEGTYPAEVQPLVDDLNALLEHRERTVQKALAKAGDLAHGLKTPLAVLSQEAAQAEASGNEALASSISQQVDRMHRQVEHHLAHARAAASGALPGAHCSVKVSADALARTLRRLHDGRGIVIDVNVPDEHAIRGQREDVDEMLGNLMDNACKWARRSVVVQSAADDGVIAITVDDDGAGIDESMREAVLRRGVRADEAAPGSGLGLAIVRDLADLYGGGVSLERSPQGGVRASLRLPSA